MRARALPVVGLLVCVGACASVKYSTGPGSGAGTVRHRLDELSFEVVGNWVASETPDGLSLKYCIDQPDRACVLLWTTMTDVFKSDCGNGAAVAGWLYQGRQGAPTPAATAVAGHPAWRFDRPADHILVICNGKRSWTVRARAFGYNQDRFAATAFDVFLVTAKLDPAFVPKS